MSEQLSRRDFLRLSALTAAGVAVAACAKTPTEAPKVATPTKKAEVKPTATPEPVGPSAKQSPLWAEEVKGGKLPALEERLPPDPVVIPVVEEIGQYGGDWRRAWKGPGDTGGPARLWPEALVHFSPDGTKFEPNVFAEWEATEEGKVFTCKISEGIKWSDGEPVTADDFLYWYEDVMLNEEISPHFPSWMKAGGEPGVVEKADDFTVRFKFDFPFPLFILYIAEPRIPAPKHYMEQFHPTYTSQAEVDKLAKDADFEHWFELYGVKGDMMDNPELPVWNPWVVTTRASATRYVAERNPYYWKVDPDGNQLPYIDRIVHDLVEETELYVTKAIAGELDMQGRHLAAGQYPLLKENEEKGDYRVLVWKPTLGSNFTVMFNQTFEADPVVAKYITDAKFKQALSVAIDRDDFNQIMYLGKATPRQATVMDISPDFEPEYATRYIEHDPDKASEWLDELGLDKKDKDGFRLAPESGEALVMTISFATIPPYADGCELVKEYWEKVGIKTVVKGEERSVHYERMSSNELQISVWGMDGALYPLWLNYAYWIVPWVAGSNRIGTLYGLYRDSGGKSGKEPVGDVGKALEIFDRARAEVDKAKSIELASQVLDIASENLWTIGTVLLAQSFMVAKNNMRNVPEVAISDWILRTPKNTHTEQYFIKS